MAQTPASACLQVAAGYGQWLEAPPLLLGCWLLGCWLLGCWLLGCCRCSAFQMAHRPREAALLLVLVHPLARHHQGICAIMAVRRPLSPTLPLRMSSVDPSAPAEVEHAVLLAAVADSSRCRDCQSHRINLLVGLAFPGESGRTHFAGELCPIPSQS